MTFSDLCKKYSNISADKFNHEDERIIGGYLQSVEPDELLGVAEHRAYLDLLKKYRESIRLSTELYGKNFLKTLEATFSVGEDGLYSNSLRFLFELIQNVDDCEYSDPTNCNLNVKFDCSKENIILSYNEKGFSPFNVFSITGIAERAKNLTAEKIEIGEKGVGFKSVFGVAESVLIQSGYFSFELFRGDFTIPKPYYDRFTFTEGTRLTLRLSARSVHEIYTRLMKQYCQTNALVNSNPILFLNKLTQVKLYIDEAFHYLKFTVTRSDPQKIAENLYFESNVAISLKYSEPNISNTATPYEKTIICYRYKRKQKYNAGSCLARYGDERFPNGKDHQLIAVFPHVDDLTSQTKHGALYSFLPTQIGIPVPMVLHVPYKLDGSREFVDSQNNNSWFTFTNENLGSFLQLVYEHLARQVKQYIIKYIPKKDEFFFKSESGKVDCLRIHELSGSILSSIPLFYTEDNRFLSADKVIAFSNDDCAQNDVDIYSLLDLKKSLFISPDRNVRLENFGIEVLSNACDMVFEQVMSNPFKAAKGFAILLSNDRFSLPNAIANTDHRELNIIQMACICKEKKLLDFFLNDSLELVRKGNIRKLFLLNYHDDHITESHSFFNDISEIMETADPERAFSRYLDEIHRTVFLFDFINEQIAFPFRNGLLISQKESLRAFADFGRNFDPKRTFTTAIDLYNASEELNSAPDSMTESEYISLLSRIRHNQILAFGKSTFANYIRLINEASIDSTKFLHELLQNADDCQYSICDSVPKFMLKCEDKRIGIAYTEDGFCKEDVRALTAIGESTKKKLLSDRANIIGEKGIGFKSVFKIASSVEIDSRDFHFTLDDKNIIVPSLRRNSKRFPGTSLTLTLKDNLPPTIFDKESLLRLCLCLRNLKLLSFNENQVVISDENDRRTISINGEEFPFIKTVHTFNIQNEKILAARERRERKISRQLIITCYTPIGFPMSRYFLYCGLPTSINANIPVIIDAPFETSTSREGIIKNAWNELIKEEVYKAIIRVIDIQKYTLRLEVLKYILMNEQFSDPFLCNAGFIKMVADYKMLPITTKDVFVSPSKTACWIYPDVFHYLYQNSITTAPCCVVDTYKKQYSKEALIILGCKTPTIRDLITQVAPYVKKLLSNETSRNMLYEFLSSISKFVANDTLSRDHIRSLEIIPVKTKEGKTIYIHFSDNIYFSLIKISNDEYYILDESVLSVDTYNQVFTTEIHEMTTFEIKDRYQKRILLMLDRISNNEALANSLLKEWQTNPDMFEFCRDSLISRVDKVPMRFLNGNYEKGNKFLNDSGYTFTGTIARLLVVDVTFEGFANFLRCKGVKSITQYDIDVNVDDKLDVNDIEDFLNGGLDHSPEIMRFFIERGKVPKELIEKYCLEGVVIEESMNRVDFDDDPFPSNPIRSNSHLARIRDKIRNAWKNPVKFIFRPVMKREPEIPIYEDEYVLGMYSHDDNDCVYCQKCQNVFSKRYVEVNEIQKKPEFAWPQMHLCLCLKCSKDYILLRNNSVYHEKFINNLKAAALQDDPVVVSMGNGENNVYFTAVHLAEIQEILSLEPICRESK